jgi:hypothetical protein
MTTTPQTTLLTQTRNEAARPVLMWVFRRDYAAITCEVVNRSGRCEVRTVPQWDPSLAVVEPFDNAGDALMRHAQVAERLREIGWHVADRVPMQPLAA